MASLEPGKMIKEVRMRKRMQQDLLLRQNALSAQTLSRMENERQTPHEEVLENLLTEVEMKMDNFFCPYLDGAASGVYQMRNQLLVCLDEPEDENALKEAGRIIERFEKMEIFNKELNLHFLLSCKARYNEAVKGDTATTRKLIREGIKITFPEFETGEIEDGVLIFEEAEFLHTYALTVAREGNLDTAIKTLQKIIQGLKKLQEDDREKEKKLAKVLLTLAKCLMQAGDFERALNVCEDGNEASLKYSRGRYTPDFLHVKAVCLLCMRRLEESKAMFNLAYFGYSLFHRKKQADMVRNEARETAGFEINTYGVDKLEFEPIDYHKEYDVKIQKFSNIGEMFHTWRKQAGLTLVELSRGICNKGYLQRIETNKVKQVSVYILEALAERLGRDHNHYFNTFVSPKVFKEKQMRNEILALLMLHEYEKAGKLLTVLEKSKDYQDKINLQFIFNAKATVLSKSVDRGEKYADIVMEAIKITMPDFDEKDIRRYPLTHTEKMLINKLANFYASNGDIPRAVKITERLIENIIGRVIDESERLRSYGKLLYNYSKSLGGLERYKEELMIAEEGIALSVISKQLIIIPGLYINKGSAVYHLYEKKEESLAYFAMAYYGSAIVNNHGNKKKIFDFVKKEIEIELN